MNSTFQEKQLLHLNLYYQNLIKLKSLKLLNPPPTPVFVEMALVVVRFLYENIYI